LTAKSNYELGSVDEIRRLFEDSGFKIDRLSPAVGRKKILPERYRRHRRYNVVATRIG
jgi:hypothetical protein